MLDNILKILVPTAHVSSRSFQTIITKSSGDPPIGVFCYDTPQEKRSRYAAAVVGKSEFSRQTATTDSYDRRTMIESYDRRTMIESYDRRTMIESYDRRTMIESYDRRTMIESYDNKKIHAFWNIYVGFIFLLLQDFPSGQKIGGGGRNVPVHKIS